LSNLLKSGFVTFQEEKKRIINSNEFVAKRLSELNIKGWEQVQPDSGALTAAESDGFDPETKEALFGERSGNIYQEAPVYDGPSPEELVEAAKQEIEEMKASAMQETEQLRQQAIEEARNQGYEEGYSQGQARAREEAAAAERETEAFRRSLQEDYEKNLQGLEPMLIEEITAIYDHVFNAELKDRKEILYHLLDTTLHQIDSGKEFIIRVSREDYPYISSHKEGLLEGMGSAVLDVVEDAVLKKGDGMIETGGGLFDCSIDAELKELKNRLRTLAYDKGETVGSGN